MTFKATHVIVGNDSEQGIHGSIHHNFDNGDFVMQTQSKVEGAEFYVNVHGLPQYVAAGDVKPIQGE